MSAPTDAEVLAVAAGLTKEFGPACSSGVHAILLHDSLPEQFAKDAWTEWFFKPSDAAFDRAHDMGLITPRKLSDRWSLTPLGLALRNHLLNQDQPS